MGHICANLRQVAQNYQSHTVVQISQRFVERGRSITSLGGVEIATHTWGNTSQVGALEGKVASHHLPGMILRQLGLQLLHHRIALRHALRLRQTVRQLPHEHDSANRPSNRVAKHRHCVRQSERLQKAMPLHGGDIFTQYSDSIKLHGLPVTCIILHQLEVALLLALCMGTLCGARRPQFDV